MGLTTMTPGAQILISIIPIVGIAFAAIIIFFALLWRHKETKQRIASGEYKPRNFNFKAFSLLAGLLLAGVGFTLTLMFVMLEGLSYDILGGAIPFAIGLMLILFFKINPEFKNLPEDEE